MTRSLRPVSNYTEKKLAELLYTDVGDEDLFLTPHGERGLVPPDGLTAKIYALPMTVFIGGIAAVILELAEPRVRHGVWDHSIFPTDPVLRLRRTGLAAMVTFYAARSKALSMIEGINRRHADVSGVTEKGEAYHAADPELLTWVQATAAWGFIRSYARYAEQLSMEEWDEVLAEASPVAKAYGVPEPPMTRTDIDRLFGRMIHRLEPSETLETFLSMMRTAKALPAPAHGLQPLLVRAAVDLVPKAIRTRIGLEKAGLRSGEGQVVRGLVRASRLLELRNHPAALQRRRLSKASPTR